MAAAPDAVPASLRPTVYSQDRCAHVIHFYAEESFLLDELSRFIGTALIGGDVAIVIATSPHREDLAKRLSARGLDLSRALQWGRYVPLDASETLARFMVNGLPDAEKFYSHLGEVIERAALAGESNSPRIFAFGEMVALLWAQGNSPGAIRLEQLWNALAKTYSFHLRCAYPISHFDKQEHAEAFQQICREHSSVIPVESYTALSSDEERLYIISQLQQKAQVLENEVAERKRIQEQLLESQEALRKSHEELELRVSSRTQDLANAELRLRQLSRTLLNLRDEERRRLARELHDSTGQTLAALGLNLIMMQKADLDPEISEKVAESLRLADAALQEIRTISYLLHPPMLDEAGLVLALEWYVEGFAERSKMKIELDLPRQYERLPQEMELTIFRIVQESLTNVYRHSGSPSARVSLTVNAQQVQLSIEDAGRGMSKEVIDDAAGCHSGVGLRGMRERAYHLGGNLEITPANPGTCIRVTLPMRTDAAKGRKPAQEP